MLYLFTLGSYHIVNKGKIISNKKFSQLVYGIDIKRCVSALRSEVTLLEIIFNLNIALLNLECDNNRVLSLFTLTMRYRYITAPLQPWNVVTTYSSGSNL